METILSREEVAGRAKALYEAVIREKVETESNIGKMVTIDVETGDFITDEQGINASRALQSRRPGARLFGIRIGYNVAESLGGVMERTVR